MFRELVIKSFLSKKTSPVSLFEIISTMKILKIKEKYEEKTGIPKEDCILKNWEGKIMQNEKTIGDYVDKLTEHRILSDETK